MYRKIITQMEKFIYSIKPVPADLCKKRLKTLELETVPINLQVSF